MPDGRWLVKSAQMSKRAAVMLACGLIFAGCPYHETGLVHATEGGPSLEAMTGPEVRLVLVGADAAPVSRLDGHQAEIWGTRIARRVRVTDWKVPEGLHGFQAWVGPLERRGAQLGLTDRNTGAYVLLDDAAQEALGPFVGGVVLVEGYVQGAHRVQVVYYRDLGAPAPTQGEAR